MQIKTIASLFALTLGLTATAYARPLFQAGDIAEGQQHTITKESGPASYFKEGSSGALIFSCELQGINAKAILHGGKNFTVNTPHVLSPGPNGPYTWTLRALGNKTGNIRINLIKGTSATIRCVETS